MGSVQEQIEVLSKAVISMCSVMRTHPDLSANAHMDLGFVHAELIKLRREQSEDEDL